MTQSLSPNLCIAEEIAGNRFKIADGQSGMKVSWQVAGIRQGAWANANRIPVEELKPVEERGTYLHLEVYRQPKEKGLDYQLWLAARCAQRCARGGMTHTNIASLPAGGA